MLSLICGPHGFGKSSQLYSDIERCLGLNDGARFFVIVPEQESVRAEKALLEHFGNRINERLEILNFSRLANRVFREAGGITYKYIDTGGKDLFVAMLLEDSFESLSSFDKLSEDEGFVTALRAELDAFRLSGMTSDKLRELSRDVLEKEINAKKLSDKLLETSELYSLYEGAIKHSGVDTVDDLNRLVETLDEYDFFYNSYVFIDGFYDFTFPEYEIIKHIILNANDTFVTLPLVQNDTEGVFTKAHDAYLKLLQLCRDGEVEYEERWLSERKKKQTLSLAFLADRIIDGTRNSDKLPSDDAITLTACPTMFDECTFVAKEIVRLVKNGARFSDIAVCAGSISDYGSMLEDIFDKFGIRYLSGERETLISKPLVRFLFSALDVVESGFYLPRVKAYLESPFLPLEKKERYQLINYITSWNVSASLWKSEEDWVMNPRGYIEKMSEEEKEELREVNLARRKVSVPLLTLMSSLLEKKVSSKVRALWEFLVSSGAEAVLKNRIQALSDKGEHTAAQDEASVWNLTLSALDRLSDTATERDVGLSRFIKYMRIVLADSSFGRIPSSLDEVEIGDIAFIRTGRVKHLFLMGFNEDSFPATAVDKSVFSEFERQLLCRYDEHFNSASQEKLLQNEVFHFLIALSCPESALHLTCHTFSDGKSESRPSFFVPMIESYIDLPVKEYDPFSDLPAGRCELEDWVLTADGERAQAYIEMIEREDKAFADELRRKLKSKVFLSDNLSFSTPPEIYKNGINMTQARLDTYAKCPFSYFSNYMLSLRTHKKIEFRAAEMGSLVHKVLEEVLSTLAAEKTKLCDVSGEYAEKLAKKSAEDYLSKAAPEISSSSRRFKYLTSRLVAFVVYIIENMREEFKNSEFSPVLFEEKMKEGGEIPPYRVELDGGAALVFYGCVDRVDMYEENGVKYLRVVDYKTKVGGKTFNLNDVINGINLQLLVYLFAAWGDDENAVSTSPAGIMYMPASYPSILLETRTQAENEKQTRDGAMKRSGLFLLDENILDAMEKGIEGRVIPVRRKKEGGYTGESTLATLEQFGKLKRYTNKVFANLAKKLQKGEVPASPLVSSELDPCSWCDFKAFCRYEGCGRQYRKVSRAWDEIEENSN